MLATTLLASCGELDSNNSSIAETVSGQDSAALTKPAAAGTATPAKSDNSVDASNTQQLAAPAASQQTTAEQTAAVQPAATQPEAAQPGNTPPADTQPANSEAPRQSAQGSAAHVTTNTIDTMINDMALLNDLPLTGVDPKYGFARGPGYVIMGNDPRGTNTPQWHKNKYPHLVNGQYWEFLLPWFVHFEGDGNKATNTRIQMQNLRVLMRSRSTGQWSQLNQSDNTNGTQCPHGSNYFHCSRAGEIRREADNTLSTLPVAHYNLHGWWGNREQIDGPDVGAIVVTMQARLIVDNTRNSDDRDNAKYLIQVGADYYYTDGSAPTVLPAVGISRAKLLTKDWQSFSMTTFSDVGKQEPGGGISKNEMYSNPPPLD